MVSVGIFKLPPLVMALLYLSGGADSFVRPSSRAIFLGTSPQAKANAGSPATSNRGPKIIGATSHRTTTNSALKSTLAQMISHVSNPASSMTHQLTNNIEGLPVIGYFLVLVAAGFGIPVSEDLLCIFAGTMMPLSKIRSPARRIRLVLALYLGVVISDMITFSIGRMMKVGLLEPLRKRMNLGQNNQNEDGVPVNGSASSNEEGVRRKRDRVMQKLESAGDWAGFCTRLSPGFRPAMMILAGFWGKVSYSKYFLGTAAGGTISLTAQLLLGYSVRHNKPSDIVALSSKVLVVAPAVLIIGFVVLLIRQGGPTKRTSPPSNT